MPLDLVTGAVFAVSLCRRLRRAYTGPLVRLRRASDDAEADFCPTVRGIINVSEVATFLAGSNGFVKTLYDQSGNAYDASQSTAAAQPQYGAFGVRASQPGIRFDATDDALALATGLGMARNVAGFTITGVCRSTNNPTVARTIFRTSTNASAAAIRSGLARGLTAGKFEAIGRRLDADSAANAEGGTVSVGTYSIDTARFDYANTTATMFVDGTSVGNNASFQTAGNTQDADSAAVFLGYSGVANTAWDGDLCELVCFASALSAANRQALERNMGGFYNKAVA